MNKYAETLAIDSTKTIPFFRSTLLSQTPVETIPFYYTTRFDERLDAVANKFYKSPKDWWIIAKANNLATGVISVPAGTQLYIPNV